MGPATLHTVHKTFDPGFPVLFHLSPLITSTSTGTIPTLYVVQKDRHCMPTADYYFTNIKLDPITIPPCMENKSKSMTTTQQSSAEDPIQPQLPALKPGKTSVYPSMIAENKIPVLDLTNSTITSEADLQTAFHSLNLCPSEADKSTHGRKKSTREEASP